MTCEETTGWSRRRFHMLGANREFVRKHPVATKRAIRAILERNEICARDPERIGWLYVESGYVDRAQFEFVVQAMKDLP